MFTRSLERGAIEEFVIGNDRIEVSHLQFADDTILFVSHNNTSITNGLTLMKVFEHISGLHIHMTKSGLVGINVAHSIVCNLAEVIGCATLSWPITYLGVHFGNNP